MPLFTRNSEHLAEDCRDDTCPRFPCRIYRQGFRDGYDRGLADGMAAGEAAGFAAGYRAAVAAQDSSRSG